MTSDLAWCQPLDFTMIGRGNDALRAGTMAYLAGSPDSWDQCVQRGDVVHTPQAVTNNAA